MAGQLTAVLEMPPTLEYVALARALAAKRPRPFLSHATHSSRDKMYQAGLPLPRVYSFFLPPKLIMCSIEGEEGLGTRLTRVHSKLVQTALL